MYCSDLEGLVDHVCTMRSLSLEDACAKVGIDGGGGFFKICLSLYEKEVTEKCDHRFLNTGVKKLLVLAICPDVKESYENVRDILMLLNLNDVLPDCTFALDLKLANIMAGIQCHSSSYPCLWCECPRSSFNSETSNSYALRTLGSVRQYAENFKSSNSGTSSAKVFQSCTNPPLFNGPDNEIFFNKVTLSELHLLLRVVNKLFKELENVLSLSGSSAASDWLSSVGIVRPKLHGGEFNGNMCRKLLSSADLLERILIQQQQFAAMPYLTAFRTFNNVVSACFSQELKPNFSQNILQFKEAYKALNISVTSSVHVIFVHLVQFCKFKRQGLGNFSEQASESVHSDFQQLWAGGTSMANKNYEKAFAGNSNSL